MATQITHEAEVHRQHVRLKIPIAVEIDGTRFTVDDWSMGGFGIQSDVTSRQPGERFPVRLVFPFEDFELSLRVDAQMVYLAEDRTRFGCKFLALSYSQAALFRYLVDAYLSGELVSAGDILDLAGRDNTAEARVHPLSFNPFAEEETMGRKVRRGLGLALLAAAGIGLGALVWLGIDERFLTVRAETAMVEAPVFRIRAPVSGLLERSGVEGILKPGQVIGNLRGLEGQSAALTSPCICVFEAWRVPEGQYAQVGEVVAVLVSAEKPLSIRAEMPFDRALRLSVGGLAEIHIPGRSAPLYGQIEAIDFKASSLADLGEPRRPEQQRAQILIRPDTPLDFEELGSLVDVRFP
jgi:alginate biosynthesis protein Alg44